MPEQHRKCHGLSRPQAELEYLKLAQRLAAYGLEFIELRSTRSGRPAARLGICSRGITVEEFPPAPSTSVRRHRGSAYITPAPTAPPALNRHSWRDIRDIEHRGRNLTVHAAAGNQARKYSLRADSKAKAEYAYRRFAAYNHFHRQMGQLMAEKPSHSRHGPSHVAMQSEPAHGSPRRPLADGERAQGPGPGQRQGQGGTQGRRGLAMQHAQAARATPHRMDADERRPRTDAAISLDDNKDEGATALTARLDADALRRQAEQQRRGPHPLLSRFIMDEDEEGQAAGENRKRGSSAQSQPQPEPLSETSRPPLRMSEIDIDELDFGFGDEGDTADGGIAQPSPPKASRANATQPTQTLPAATVQVRGEAHTTTTRPAPRNQTSPNESSTHRPRAQAMGHHQRPEETPKGVTSPPAVAVTPPLATSTPKTAASSSPTTDASSVISHPTTEQPAGHVKVVTLRKHPRQPLGLSIVGPGIIRAIHANSVAAEDGRLHKKEQIIKINGVSVVGLDHDEIIRTLRNAPDTIVLAVVSPEKREGKSSKSSLAQGEGARGSPVRSPRARPPPLTHLDDSEKAAPAPIPAPHVSEADELPPPPEKPPRRGQGRALGAAREMVLAKSSSDGLGFSIAAAPEGGVCVSRVIPGSPADKARLQTGDVLLAADGRGLRSATVEQTRALLSATGREVRLVAATPEPLSRSKPAERLQPASAGAPVSVALWPPHAAPASSGPLVELELRRDSARKLGMILAGGTDKHLGGVFVTYVPPDTPAAAAGLQRGDRILNVDGTSTEVSTVILLFTPGWVRFFQTPQSLLSNTLSSSSKSRYGFNPLPPPPSPIARNSRVGPSAFSPRRKYHEDQSAESGGGRV